MVNDVVHHTLTWPWLIPVVLVTLVVLATLVIWRTRRSADAAPDHDQVDDGVVWVANSDRVGHSHALRRWTRRYRAWQWTGIALLVVAVGASSVLVARPANVQVKQSTLGTRDIVLCLDISGSMLEYDRQMVDAFRTLVKSFDGERIALSVFNETSRTVFPLTNDYTLISQQLDVAYDALDPSVLGSPTDATVDRYLNFASGTSLTNKQSSLIGDGLANCSLLFDDSGSTTRSRSIILATDNDLRGNPVYSLTDAVELAVSRRIELSALYGASSWVVDPSIESDYRSAVTDAGGYFYHAADASAVADIIARVQSQQAVDLSAAPEVTRSEAPAGWIMLALLGVAGLVLVQWRVRE